MSESAAITGTPRHRDRPNWAPLLALVGDALVGELMWMGEIVLADGAVVHAYKHVLTRRYLHIAEDGRTLAFVAPGRYRPIDAEDALAAAFHEWEHLADDRYDDVGALRAALRQAHRKAGG